MNRSEKEKERKILILKGLLIPHTSKYQLVEDLKDANYATVHRYILKMTNEGLVRTSGVLRKDGKQDRRGTKKPELTPKGLATILIEGDLQKKELASVVRKILEKKYSSLPIAFLTKINIDDAFANMLLSMKPKVNLKYFDEEYFNGVFITSLLDAIEKAVQKIEIKGDGTVLRAEVTEFLGALKKMSEKEGFSQFLDNLSNPTSSPADELKKQLALKGTKRGV